MNSILNPLQFDAQLKLDLLSQIINQMNQLLVPINTLNQQLLQIQIHTAKINYNQNHYIATAEQYNTLVAQYNILQQQYELILSSVYSPTNVTNKPRAQWDSLSSLPSTPFSNTVKINDHSFIFAIDNAICCYDAKKDTWNPITKYPNQFHLDSDSPIIYNKKTNELYLINGLVKNIDMDYSSFFDNSIAKLAKIKITSSSSGLQAESWNFTNIQTRENFAGSSLLIDDTLHYFAGGSNTKHRMISKGLFDNEFSDFETFEKDICNLSNVCVGNVQHGLIHIVNENRILLLGGMNMPNYPTAFDTIWNYDICTEKWNVMKQKLPYKMYGFGHILTADEKYIILIGGGKEKDNNGYEFIDNIFVIELDTMKIKESKIKCPEKGIFEAISLVNDNKCLVNGFVRDCENKYGVELSSDLYNLMNKWYKEEYIHIVQRSTCKHWKVNVVEIISNLK